MKRFPLIALTCVIPALAPAANADCMRSDGKNCMQEIDQWYGPMKRTLNHVIKNTCSMRVAMIPTVTTPQGSEVRPRIGLDPDRTWPVGCTVETGIAQCTVTVESKCIGADEDRRAALEKKAAATAANQ